jgi:hypothetical protein
MDIRLTRKDYPRVAKAFARSAVPDKSEITLTRDESLDQSLIMVKTEGGTLEPWTFGRENILSYLACGVVHIRKRCPFSFLRLGKCRGKKCQLYQVRNGTGDCALVWNLFT